MEKAGAGGDWDCDARARRPEDEQHQQRRRREKGCDQNGRKQVSQSELARSLAVAALTLSLAIKGFIHNICGRGRRSGCV